MSPETLIILKRKSKREWCKLLTDFSQHNKIESFTRIAIQSESSGYDFNKSNNFSHATPNRDILTVAEIVEYVLPLVTSAHESKEWVRLLAEAADKGILHPTQVSEDRDNAAGRPRLVISFAINELERDSVSVLRDLAHYFKVSSKLPEGVKPLIEVPKKPIPLKDFLAAADDFT